MSMITAQRIASSLLGGSMSGAQLETLLGTAAGLAGWKLAAATHSISSVLAEDATAKAAWKGSTKAVTTMAELSASGADAIAADTVLMSSIFNTQARADAWFASATARAALWNSDTALNALMGSPTGKARARACAKYLLRSVSGQGVEVVFPYPLGKPMGKFILVGWSLTGTGPINLSGRREWSEVGVVSSSYPPAGSAANADNVAALLGPVKLGTASGTTVYLGFVEV